MRWEFFTDDYLGHYDLRQAPPGERLPPLVVDSHEIAYDLARQFARVGDSLCRRVYAHLPRETQRQ